MAVTGRQFITTSNLKAIDEAESKMRLEKVVECSEILSKNSKWQ